MKSAVLCAVAAVVVLGNGQASEPIGTIDWVHQGGSTWRDTSQGMCGTPDGSFYLTGWFELQYDDALDSQPTTYGLRDIYVSKYNAAGDLLWVQSAGSGHCDVSGAIAALSNGDCAITGAYGYGTANCLFGYRQPNQTNLRAIGLFDLCVAKYDGDGFLQWATRAGGTAQDFGEHIAMALDGSVYVGGYSVSDTVTFGHGLPTETTLTNPLPGNVFYFLAWYSADGTFEWAKPINCQGVVALENGGCMVHTQPGLVWYSADGTEVWADETMATGPCSMMSLPHDAFVVAYTRPDSSTRVALLQASPQGDVSVVWERVIPDCTVYYKSPMVAGFDGRITFCAAGKLCTVGWDGTWHEIGNLNHYAPIGMSCLPDSPYCYFTKGFYSDVTLGDTTLVHKGSGDFFIARASTSSQYTISARCQNPGWIDFNGHDARYAHNETAALTAVPVFPGVYEFTEWQDDLAGTEAAQTFSVTEDMNVTAVFEHVDGAPELPAASCAALGMVLTCVALTRVRAKKSH